MGENMEKVKYVLSAKWATPKFFGIFAQLSFCLQAINGAVEYFVSDNYLWGCFWLVAAVGWGMGAYGLRKYNVTN